MKINTNEVPKPGSDAASKIGCTCAVLDNNYGAGAYIVNGEPVFWISGDCPVHTVDCGIDDCRLIKSVWRGDK